jgi:hypothetical protein
MIGRHPFWTIVIAIGVVAFIIFGLGHLIDYDLNKSHAANARLD